MDMRLCKDCAYFRQHYTLREGKLIRIYCGHCTLRRSKKTTPITSACQQFSPAPADESAFVSKDYLTKTLLHHLLSLELLPPIEEAEE